MSRKKLLLISLIILTGVIIRLWNFSSLFYFAIDEEKGAYIIHQITSREHFPTVGHPSSIGFRLGPGLYYALSPFYALLGESPITWGYLSVLASILTMILVWYLGSLISPRTGIYALCFSSYSYLNVLYERRGWQVSFHSLIALTILFSLVMIRRGKTIYWYLLTVGLIAATHVEVATILFVPLVLIIILTSHFTIPKKTIIICVCAFLSSHVSLLIFDMRHQYLNTRYLINYFRPDASIRIKKNIPLIGDRQVYQAHNLIPSTLIRTIYNPTEDNAAIQYANCPQYLSKKQHDLPKSSFIIWTIVIVLFFTLLVKERKSSSESQFILRIIGIYTVIIVSGISFYTYTFHGEMAEYYLFSLFSFFFLSVAYMLDMLFQKKLYWIAFGILMFFLLGNAGRIYTTRNPYGYQEKEEAISYILKSVGPFPFRLDSYQTCWYSGGYRYLFSLYGKSPTSSYMDQYLTEYYTIEKQNQPKYVVTILTPEIIGLQPAGYLEFRESLMRKITKHKQFGSIEVFIEDLSI